MVLIHETDYLDFHILHINKEANQIKLTYFPLLLHFSVLSLSFKYENTPVPFVQVHPPSATRILLPNRNMSYHEQGVS